MYGPGESGGVTREMGCWWCGHAWWQRLALTASICRTLCTSPRPALTPKSTGSLQEQASTAQAASAQASPARYSRAAWAPGSSMRQGRHMKLALPHTHATAATLFTHLSASASSSSSSSPAISVTTHQAVKHMEPRCNRRRWTARTGILPPCRPGLARSCHPAPPGRLTVKIGIVILLPAKLFGLLVVIVLAGPKRDNEEGDSSQGRSGFDSRHCCRQALHAPCYSSPLHPSRQEPLPPPCRASARHRAPAPPHPPHPPRPHRPAGRRGQEAQRCVHWGRVDVCMHAQRRVCVSKMCNPGR